MAGHDVDTIRLRFSEGVEVKRALLEDDALIAQVADAADRLARAFEAGGRALLCGNGGSAADAAHLAAELVGRFLLERAPLSAVALAENTSAVTCVANDYAFDEIFARQVLAHGRPGDVLIGISTSGTSPNVVRAVEVARAAGLQTIALTGASGGDLAERADVCLRIPSDVTARIQEAHMLVGHTLCELVERRLFGDD